jgi:ATP-dependent Clp protease protease subunit
MTRPNAHAYVKMRIANKGRGEFRADGNTLFLYDAIASDDDEATWWGGISPSAFIAALDKTTGPVTLRINSPGGSVFGAQAMVAAMRAHAHPITARIDSLAASAASVIAANCAKCVMVPGSMQMIHRAWGLAIGNCEDMRGTADLLEKIDGLIAEAYAERANGGKDHDEFVALMAKETWFTPEEAMAAGLADAIAQENTQRGQNQWDLSAFGAAPVLADVPAPEEDTDTKNAPEPKPAETQARDRAVRLHRLTARLAIKPI